MAHTTGGSEKTDGGKRPRARSGGVGVNRLTPSPPSPLLRRLHPADLTKDQFVLAPCTVYIGPTPYANACAVCRARAQPGLRPVYGLAPTWPLGRGGGRLA